MPMLQMPSPRWEEPAATGSPCSCESMPQHSAGSTSGVGQGRLQAAETGRASARNRHGARGPSGFLVFIVIVLSVSHGYPALIAKGERACKEESLKSNGVCVLMIKSTLVCVFTPPPCLHNGPAWSGGAVSEYDGQPNLTQCRANAHSLNPIHVLRAQVF